MALLEDIVNSIDEVGVKEVARRSGLAPSTVSRVRNGLISPSFEVIHKISKALGKRLELIEDDQRFLAPRLISAKRTLSELKPDLREWGVKHVVIFGSVARGEDSADSDIDIYLDFGDRSPRASELLAAEGKVLEAFGDQKVDIVSHLQTSRGQRLLKKIEKDGIRVF